MSMSISKPKLKNLEIKPIETQWYDHGMQLLIRVLC